MASSTVVLHTSPPPRMTFRPGAGRHVKVSRPRKRLIMRRRMHGATAGEVCGFMNWPNYGDTLPIVLTHRVNGAACRDEKPRAGSARPASEPIAELRGAQSSLLRLREIPRVRRRLSLCG